MSERERAGYVLIATPNANRAESYRAFVAELGNEVMVSVQAHMREEGSVRALSDQINTVERAMKQAFPEVRWSFFEPDFKPAA